MSRYSEYIKSLSQTAMEIINELGSTLYILGLFDDGDET